MNPALLKVDASGADEKEKSGLSSDLCNCVKLYVCTDLAKTSKRVEKEEEITGEDSVVYEDCRGVVLKIFRLPGVAFIWVYPNAIHVHKKVWADWENDEGDGVYEQACSILKADLAHRYPGQPFVVKFIKGCEFPSMA